MGSQQTIRPTTGLIAVPLNYPTTPTPGKLEILIQSNDHAIYHRYSPYTEGVQFLGFGSKQPYIYDYIDKAKSGLSGLRRYESRAFPLGSAPRDVIRVTKFLTSGNGILFLGKQFLLQTFNAFNETRIYNPTSPIVAAGMGLGLGLIGRPQRNFDTSGGLLGIARTLIGNTLPDLFGGQNINPPAGTLGGSLPISGIGKNGKGLLRAQTANRGRGMLTARWSGPSNTGLGGFFKNLVKSVFGNFFPASQKPAIYRSDEDAYGLMLASDKFNYISTRGATIKFTPLWYAGGTGGENVMRREKKAPPSSPSKIAVDENGQPTYIRIRHGGIEDRIHLIGQSFLIGFIRNAEGNNQQYPGVRYGDSIGVKHSDKFESSEMMINYKFYSDPKDVYPTKQTKYQIVDDQNAKLKKVIDNLNKVSDSLYQVNVTDQDSRVINSGEISIVKAGYDRLFATKEFNQSSPLNYPLGLLKFYKDKDVRMVDNSITTNAADKSLKLPGAGNFDAINTLRIIPGKGASLKTGLEIPSGRVINWTKWRPYKDDQIAFFFYDAVNDKYIPFRATVKGISEATTANWDDLTFIGRADRLYSYGGFNRTLTFNFDIVISSVIELAPTWKRINYLMSLVKPAGYTKSKSTGINDQSLSYNKFMIPPMVMLTIGDMYKSQPIMIQNITIGIPDDATWETMNEDNTTEWQYLADYIKSTGVNKEFGQFPREAKINVSCVLLEKERAIMGAANFGHAPHTDAYFERDINTQPAMHKALVEYQNG